MLFADPIAGFEVEPNDRAVYANLAELGQGIQGFIGHVADEDWYRYELAAAEPAEDGGQDSGADTDAGMPTNAPGIALRMDLTAV